MDQGQVSGTPEHEAAKATKWKPASVSGRRSWSRASRRQRAVQAKERSTTHLRGSRTNPRFAAGGLTTSRMMPCARAASAGRSPV